MELVVLVGLLPIWLRRDEHVDPDFEAGGVVDNPVATAGLTRPFSLTAATSNACTGRTYFTWTVRRRTLSSPTVFTDPAQA